MRFKKNIFNSQGCTSLILGSIFGDIQAGDCPDEQRESDPSQTGEKGRSPSTEDRAGEQMKRLDRGTDKTAFEETDGNGPVCSVFCR